MTETGIADMVSRLCYIAFMPGDQITRFFKAYDTQVPEWGEAKHLLESLDKVVVMATDLSRDNL